MREDIYNIFVKDAHDLKPVIKGQTHSDISEHDGKMFQKYEGKAQSTSAIHWE